MKFLICGLGSIGQRHARNLKTILPSCQIIALRRTQKNISGFEQKYSIKSLRFLKQALNEKPDAAFITNPTSLHLPVALACAEHGVDLFIEKPLSHSWNKVEELEDVIKQKKLVVMAGFMMRYNKGILKIRQLLEKKIIGDVLSVQIINGEYLPNWHKGEDYQKSYSARKNLGGGIILNFTHELDYASWLFGPIEKISCITNKSKTLKTNVEDSADMLLLSNRNITVNIHLDQIAQPPLRTVSIIGEKGRIIWNYYTASIKWYNPAKKKWQEYFYPFNRNSMFVSELKEFIRCLRTRKQPHVNFQTAKENLHIALTCKKSAEEKRIISL